MTAAHWGFDSERLTFTLRTACAACLALVIAWSAGLEHPQWSAMTVWAASQPTRGQLLEKGAFRFAGTVAGAIVGVLLLKISGGNPWIITVGLASWTTVTVAAGNLLRGYVAYGTILAGFSAAMVALLDSTHPEHVLALGLDRSLTVLTGVVTALAVGWVLTPVAAEDEIAGGLRLLSIAVLRHLARRARDGAAADSPAMRRLLSDMAALDDTLDGYGAGSLRSRRASEVFRHLLIAEVLSLLSDRIPAAAAEPLESAASALENGEVAGLATDGMLALQTALRDYAAVPHSGLPMAPRPQAVVHRDWIVARQSAIRAGGVMLGIGAVWAASGWVAGPFMMLGTAIMISLFSTFDDPAWVMFRIALGTLGGAAAALTCQWLVWPHATASWQMVAMMLPFIFIGVPVLSHRRTMAGGMDVVMVLLLLLQPHYPMVGTFAGSVAKALAVVGAPFLAYTAYRLVFPQSPSRRQRSLVHIMVGELEAMARNPAPSRDSWIWRTRYAHRLLRLVRWQDKGGGSRRIGGGLAVLAVGDAIHALRNARRNPTVSPRDDRAIGFALGRLAQLSASPERAARALDRTARRLASHHVAVAELKQAASALLAEADFFRLGR